MPRAGPGQPQARRELVLDNVPSPGETGRDAALVGAARQQRDWCMTARPPLLLAALAGLAACASATPPPRPVGAAATLAPQDRFVAAVEAEGCVLTNQNLGAVLLRANLTQAELPAITAGLEAQGRLESPGQGSLRILSDNCI